ncbi:hypothetical protein Tco_0514252 [Tanacetum coccineum]
MTGLQHRMIYFPLKEFQPEVELKEQVRSSEARDSGIIGAHETLETHMSRMEWQRQRAEDDAVRQIMRTHVLEARAQIHIVEATDSSC